MRFLHNSELAWLHSLIGSVGSRHPKALSTERGEAFALRVDIIVHLSVSLI